ncbi:MAG: hypothetical protein GH155_00860 [Spirochaeta sp.]|nr:hypothetical protein [Spirochaeta sp.]
MAECSCCTDKPKTLIYSCSGAANTGYLADRVARQLAGEGVGGMTCMAAMGADLSGFVESARSASRNLVIDGCPVSCGLKIFEKLGLPYDHQLMTDHRVEKSKTPITEELIQQVKEALISGFFCD